MPNQPQASVENNFSGGLKTEFTGLNFPENACTYADNCIFSIIGDVNRRGGINFETNYKWNVQNSAEVAISTYKWNNVGGDGLTQIVVSQIGGTLYFYLASSATINNPLSTQLLSSSVNISSFTALNGTFDSTVECHYTDGNGYLFVFNKNCDPFYCTYNSATKTITANIITVKIRDTLGIFEPGVPFNYRPATLTAEHNYNLVNQGWAPWMATSVSTNTIAASGNLTFVLNSSILPIVIGQAIYVTTGLPGGSSPGSTSSVMKGTVLSYTGNTLVVTISSKIGSGTFSFWYITPGGINYIDYFYQQARTGAATGTPGSGVLLNVYPSNAEQWWEYRNTNITSASPDGTFAPNLTADYVVLNDNQAPQGSVVLPAFIQDRTAATGVTGLAAVDTTTRPTNGTWFQGRVFYTGVNASVQQQTNTDGTPMPYYTWTENIYFSQIVTTPNDFGLCYQQNDPTSSTLFDLLPSDGGVIVIQGSGSIYRLFPVQNGLLVFAANGIWFITGSQGIGFSATDYTVTKISGIQSISTHSYVNVLGWPLFWNEEGIYQVQPSKEGGGLTVNNLCLGTILSFYQDIPLQSKKYARGDYNPITYVVQWIYRSTNETDITSRYQFDSMLNLNTYKAPFYPYTVSNASGYPWIASINYVAGPGGSTSPDPTFKYFTTINNTQTTFSEENDFTNWLDWNSTGTGLNYTSTFTTGYKLHGSAWRIWRLGYIYMFSDNSEPNSYQIQGVWDYANSGTSGRWSIPQLITNNPTSLDPFGNIFRKIRIRGHGLALQLLITSVQGMPFNFAGWSMFEQINQSI
jgi:hypothetical protein